MPYGLNSTSWICFQIRFPFLKRVMFKQCSIHLKFVSSHTTCQMGLHRTEKLSQNIVKLSKLISLHIHSPLYAITHFPSYFTFTFTYTFHYFLSTPNPQIKARGSITCLLPITITTFHCHLPFSFPFSYHFQFANKPCFNANHWVHSPLSLNSLQKHLEACMP